ncbi:hypothetical protein CH253_29660 [Rhodococcus sp. 06-156-3C]|uniref:hypothetical protein n=1 Tax=Nocardiaceae TaxID=85025 RepID=UPI000522F7BC|nr:MULTISPECIES: hypothetical protein [Rhodococcus]OZD10794.1 hypothetical protein CH280_21300 [Rhodococcus sp. 06-156-4C]OZD11544.1 hypothetical protein CH253_29660 [Rhodococcus sp. 06-156-3C]OZD13780.1 hypothetical protein CH248_27165 [Rhodococcus sp. 06-156-4a]OZD28074.1 hypothetical protein CH247_19995 [Rhodococcus sp. 06-156-3b]OZD30405.1 hypothetical protein CH284_25745 [Rhodococcus sp. 06-156-3]
MRANGNDHGLMFRLSDATNFFVLTTTGRLYKCEAGSFSQIGGTAIAGSAGNVYQVVLSGSSISMKINGAAHSATVTSAFNQNATKHGLLSKNAGARSESFVHTAAVA